MRRLRGRLLPRGDVALGLDDQAHRGLVVLGAVRIGLEGVVHRHVCHSLTKHLRLVHRRIGDHRLVHQAAAVTVMEQRVAEAEAEVGVESILDLLLQRVP